MRHEYVNATTKRYIAWVDSRVEEDGEQPSLEAILSWLQTSEEYRNPLRRLRDLCFALREGGHSSLLCGIAVRLISESEEDGEFIGKVESFFGACASRFGVEDFDVRMNLGHKTDGTLHYHHNKP